MSEKSKKTDKRIHYRPARCGIVCGEKRYEGEPGHSEFWRKTLTDIRRVTCFECLVKVREALSGKLRAYSIRARKATEN